jgi:hypothetical protein
MDYGHDSVEVLDGIAALISQHQNLCCSASTQVGDLLMSHLDMKEIREVPETLMEFVNNTMKSSYPPELGNQDISRWMIRTLTTVIEHCPTGLGSKLLEFVQEGICTWVADEREVWSADDYEYEVGLSYTLRSTITKLTDTLLDCAVICTNSVLHPVTSAFYR